MNLCIDIGNTRAKWALFKNDELLEIGLMDQTTSNTINKLSTDTGAKKLILCSVRNLRFDMDQIEGNALQLSEKVLLPIKNNYQSKSTLGYDRIASVVGAQTMLNQRPILVFDAGSCITWDLLNSNNQYLGGGITNGIHQRFAALHNFTYGLPLVAFKADEAEIPSIGYDTNSSIKAGILNGVLAEIDGIIDAFKSKEKGIEIAMTGGDASFFESKLKNKIFAHPNLALVGLNCILNYHAKQAAKRT